NDANPVGEDRVVEEKRKVLKRESMNSTAMFLPYCRELEQDRSCALDIIKERSSAEGLVFL
ncbi:MAG: hypothetical protein WB973_22110, partial [Thermoanaerobaculia bacterium]